MAGIGFVLERIVERRGIRGLARVAVVGVLVVAGPWLITSVTLGAVGAISAARGLDVNLFFAVIIYIFAGSLITTSGYHYRVTRITADLLYQKRYRAMQYWFRRAATVSAGIGALLGLGIALVGSLSATVAAATLVAAVSVSVSWIAMLMVSLLTRFRAIVGAYAAGGVFTVGLILLVSPQAATAEAVATVSLFAFAGGTVVISSVLSVTILRTLSARDALLRNAGARRRVPRAPVSSSAVESAASPAEPAGPTPAEPAGPTPAEPAGPTPAEPAAPAETGAASGDWSDAGRKISVEEPLQAFATLPVRTLRRIGRIGLFLTAIIWVDKIAFWIFYGYPV
jgi:hypothetical protein